MNLPKSWNDITINQFIQLRQIKKEDYASYYTYKVEELSVLYDISVDDEFWMDIDVDKLKVKIDEFKWLDKSPTTSFKNETNGFRFIGFNNLKVGEFIDLDYLFAINYYDKLPDICSILYRKFRVNEWGHIELEPREFDNDERYNEFLELPITDVYGIISGYLSFKNKFMDAYNNLLNEPDLPDEVEDDEEEDDNKLSKDMTELYTKWSWESLIYEFANRDITKFNEVLGLSLIFFFNIQSMKKDLKL